MVRFTASSVRIKRVLSIKFALFPSLVARHLSTDYTTPAVEHHGFDYVANRFQVRQTEFFVKAVCRWGGSPSIATTLLENYGLRVIRDQLREGYSQLLQGNPLSALGELTILDGIGVSYASKHLRFLYPSGAVILDSIVRDKLGYSADGTGFTEFLNDCGLIRNRLNQLGVPVTVTRTDWRVADVEMAIFSKIKNL